MLPTCLISDLKIFHTGDSTRHLASELSCPELAAGVLEMLKGDEDINLLREWIRPDFSQQMDKLNLGEGSKAAKALWESKSSFGNVLVYGDYDRFLQWKSFGTRQHRFVISFPEETFTVMD